MMPRTWLLAASLATVALAPAALADTTCYWHPAAREFVWEFSMHTVYLEDGEQCTASLYSPGPLCTLAPRDAIWTATFHVLLVGQDCMPQVGEPECTAGGTWPKCL